MRTVTIRIYDLLDITDSEIMRLYDVFIDKWPKFMGSKFYYKYHDFFEKWKLEH